MPKTKKRKNKKTKKVEELVHPVRKKASHRKKRKIKSLKSLSKELSNGVHKTRMRVIGIGGGGSSIISEIAPQLNRVDFVAANTDLQALKEVTKKARVFHFGRNLTHGLGCGMDQKLGQKAARDEKQKIAKLFKGIDLAILVASLGGGTGSGASPEFAKIARELGVMTFGIFTLSFKFEGVRRAQIARASLEKLTPNLNAVSVIPNENIFKIIEKNTPLKDAFSAINKRLSANLRGLIETIYLPGLINIDFADLKTILEGKGSLTYLNSAIAQGANRAGEAVKEVLKSPLNEYSIQGAQKIIFNITASQDLRMKEVEEISQTISDFNRRAHLSFATASQEKELKPKQKMGGRAKIIFGVSQDNNYSDKLRITLLAVGCGKESKSKKPTVHTQESKEKSPQSEPKPLSSDLSAEARRAKAEAQRVKEDKPKKKKRAKPKPKPKKTKPKIKPRFRASFAEVASATKAEQGYSGQARLKIKPKKKFKIPIKKETLPKSKPAEQENSPISETPIVDKVPARRNALDLKKEIEKTEQDLFEQEKKWDIPAFLRRKMEN